MTADYWLLAAPLVGGAVNVAAQIIVARMLSGERLLLIIVGSFFAGLIATGAMIGIALSGADLSVLDRLGLVSSVLLVYFAGSFVLFAIVNLGETSLRIRMMRSLMDNPAGLSRKT